MSPEPRTVLVTGATGFIGRAVVARLHRAGHQVIAASRTAARRPDLFPEGLRTVGLDVTRAETLRVAFEGVQVVVHAAGKIGDWGQAEDFFAAIQRGTETVVRACLEQRVGRLVHLSSVLFYGLKGSGVMTESMLPGACPWPYAEAKVAAEDAVRRAHVDHDLDTVILRPGNVVGPGSSNWTERPAALLRRGLLALPPDAGRANPVYVENLAAAIETTCFHPSAVGQVFNVVDDTDIGWRELFGAYANALGVAPIRVRPLWQLRSTAATLELWARVSGRAPAFTRDALDYLRFRGSFSTTKLRERLDHAPPFSFAEGLTATTERLRPSGR